LKRILSVLLIGVIALSTLLSLAACSGGVDFTYTAETVIYDAPLDTGTLECFSAAVPDGYYVLNTVEDAVNPRGWRIAFLDDAGVRRSKEISEYYYNETVIAYHGIWYADGRIYTAYSPASLEDTPSIDLKFDIYDENFNLIKSVTPGTIPRWGSTNIVFDGEYFYYSYDDPKTGADIPYPNSDARVYRLNSELELVDSVNPTDSPTDPAGIMRIFLSGDGRVYTIYFEEAFFGTRYKMKPYGEGEKAVIIDTKLADADIAEYGDSNFLTYYATDDNESDTGMSVYGIKPNGKTQRIEIDSDSNIMFTQIALIKGMTEGGERSAVTVRISEPTDNGKVTMQFMKTVFTPEN
jgi:hypothetical protein